jgi:hypothetical protein
MADGVIERAVPPVAFVLGEVLKGLWRLSALEQPQELGIRSGIRGEMVKLRLCPEGVVYRDPTEMFGSTEF